MYQNNIEIQEYIVRVITIKSNICFQLESCGISHLCKQLVIPLFILNPAMIVLLSSFSEPAFSSLFLKLLKKL